MRSSCTRLRSLALLLACCLVLPAARLACQELKTPEQALGNEVGADRFLADYEQLVAWWQDLAAASDRMLLEDIGQTGYGQTQWVAVISSPENLADVERLRRSNVALALGEEADPERAAAQAASGRAVIWIDAGMHATESIAAQNILELVWQMVSRDDAEVRRILDSIVLLVCPANPDGMQMIARAYGATGRVGGLPVLYQRYVGHDNNRDFYAGNTPETRNIQRMLYRRWIPQVVYNHHQSAPRGTVIFTPPFRDPFNYNVDPLVIRGIELVAAHMNHRFASEGKPGVISRSGAPYSTWWNGGLRTTVYFHNQIGILTEVFGRPDPTPLRPADSRRLPYSDYPDPVAATTWHPRQTIDYLQTANFAILDLVARFREQFQMDQWRMARRQIERGSRDHWTATPRLQELARQRTERRREQESASEGEAAADSVDPYEDPALRDPRHYVLPLDQPDFAAATRLVRRLRRTGVAVERLSQPVTVPGRSEPVPAGSYVMHAAQAFRAHLRDMLEPQWHPDDRSGAGEPVRPYDASGWTLSMQMGVEVLALRDAHEFPGSQPVDEVEVAFPQRGLPAGPAGWTVDAGDSNRAVLINRLHAAGVPAAVLDVGWHTTRIDVDAGSLFVPASGDAATRVMREAVAELGVVAEPVPAAPPAGVARTSLRAPRIGLFDVYGGHMTTGWTQWVLKTYEFPVQLVFGERVEAGDLAADFDVLIFATGLPPATERERRRIAMRRGRSSITADAIAGLRASLPNFEDWSTIEARRVALTVEAAIPALRQFAERGGRIVAFGDQATTLARHFELPIGEGVEVADGEGGMRPARSEEFYVPGALLRMAVDVDHPLGFGVAPQQVAVFRRSDVHRVLDADAVDVVARYAAGERGMLASGWAVAPERIEGRPAVLRAPVGRGDVVLFGPDLVYRGQPVGTFKFLFNALHSAPGTTD